MQRRVLWLIVGVAGGTLVLLGVAGGLLALTLTLAGGGTPTTAESLPVAGLMALGLGLGIPLALHGWTGWRARPSRPFDPSRVWWMWLALMLLVGLGSAVSSLSLAPALLLPPIHVLTMALPPLIVLWLVGRALRGVGGSWREVVAGMAGGGILGLGIALVGEGLIAFALAVVVTAVVLTMPGGVERIAALMTDLQDPAWVTDLDNLLPFLQSPAVAISLLGLFSIPVPLIEETFKTLAAGVVARWVRPQPARAFLWGVAAGAGFALTENLFNGALGGAESWALGVIARFGATVMHCLTGGLVGWGWGQLWTARRPLRLLGSYAVAVTVHGLWNAAAIGAVLLSASAYAHGGDAFWLAPLGLGMLALIGLLGLLTVTSIFALPLAGRRLAAESERLQRTTVPPDEVTAPVSPERLVP
jgi:RsiW-degrading membrane proteinase PrsW (M82 family)